jgi:hypothetical protein
MHGVLYTHHDAYSSTQQVEESGVCVCIMYYVCMHDGSVLSSPNQSSYDDDEEEDDDRAYGVVQLTRASYRIIWRLELFVLARSLGHAGGSAGHGRAEQSRALARARPVPCARRRCTHNAMQGYFILLLGESGWG